MRLESRLLQGIFSHVWNITFAHVGPGMAKARGLTFKPVEAGNDVNGLTVPTAAEARMAGFLPWQAV